MSNKNAIEIKGLLINKTDQNQYIYTGIVYYKGKKLGRWTRNDEYDSDEYEFDRDILKDEVKIKAAELRSLGYDGTYSVDNLLLDYCKNHIAINLKQTRG